jgi:hypothetical protein
VTLSLRSETGDEVLRQRVPVAGLQPDSGVRAGIGN